MFYRLLFFFFFSVMVFIYEVDNNFIYSRFCLIGPPVDWVSCLIGSNCEERNPINDNAEC